MTIHFNILGQKQGKSATLMSTFLVPIVMTAKMKTQSKIFISNSFLDIFHFINLEPCRMGKSSAESKHKTDFLMRMQMRQEERERKRNEIRKYHQVRSSK